MLTATQLRDLEDATGRILVAFSGGCDSHALLHYLSNQLEHHVDAIHVNHQLMPEANAWQQHCESVCDGLNVMLTSYAVNVASEGSLEENARAARYKVFERTVESGDILLLAHHWDDQTETLLLNLFSGRAPMGLLGMPGSRSIGRGKLSRPLLAVTRRQIEQYAFAHKLSWIDDPSNVNQVHRRNYLRHEVIPGLKRQWPEFDRSLQQAWQVTSSVMRQHQQLAISDCDDLAQGVNVYHAKPIADFDATRSAHCFREMLRRCGYPKEPGLDLLQSLSEVLLLRPSGSPGHDSAGKNHGFDLGTVFCRDFATGYIFITLCLLRPRNYPFRIL